MKYNTINCIKFRSIKKYFIASIKYDRRAFFVINHYFNLQMKYSLTFTFQIIAVKFN